MSAYYNEIDPYAAEWLRRLILFGHIAPGDVDSRSISDVQPDDLKGYRQCHFFAGIGLWSLSLRNAGWEDDRPVWTGSCPCQPFSAAGKGKGFDDARHLWPTWFRLIAEHRPDTVFGEQVASPDGLNWFDLVSSDLEGAGYAVGASDLCAAGLGAPHIRQRLWFVAHRNGGNAGAERQQRGGEHRQQPQDGGAAGALVDTQGEQVGLSRRPREPGGACGLLADAMPAGRTEGRAGPGLGSPSSSSSIGELGVSESQQRNGNGNRDEGRRRGELADPGELGDANNNNRPQRRIRGGPDAQRQNIDGSAGRNSATDPLRGFWAGADWIWCRDGKYRPVEPSTFPLVNGYPARVGRLRAYGNAICPEVATAFITAALDILDEPSA